MEAIILAGGLGTRLKSLERNIPKPMVNVNKRPFLEIILSHLSSNGFTRVVLSVGYLSHVITNYFGKEYKNLEIHYALEKERLGTGGAIKYALDHCKEDKVFIFNGDTFLDLNFTGLIRKTDNTLRPILVTRKVKDVSRYGSIEALNNLLVGFMEKSGQGEGYINAGCYYVPREVMKRFTEKSFSFEEIAIPALMKNPGIALYNHNGSFIDIGVPEDLEKAENFLKDF